MRDDDFFPVGEARLLIPDGQYDAVITSLRTVVRYHRPQIEFQFRLTTDGFAHLTLPAYCAYELDGRRRLPAGCKLMRWLRIVAQFTDGRADRISPKSLRHYWYRVAVRQVTTNDHQQRHRDAERYSVVSELVEVIGKLSERPPAQPEDPS